MAKKTNPFKDSLSCRFFIGEKPCALQKGRGINCPCKNLSPIKENILIIKLEAMGDVLRTTPLLHALRRKYPNSQITWVTDIASIELLSGNESIDRLLPFDWKTIITLRAEEFDYLISLDKDPPSTSLASTLKAKKKFGFGRDKNGKLCPLNKAAEYAFQLGFDDDLKFRKNKKTYQEIIHEICGLPYSKSEYILNLEKGYLDFAEDLLKKNNITPKDLIIGLNTGCGKVFPMKKWTIDGYVELIKMVKGKLNAKILLLGGPEETEINKEILKRTNNAVIDTGCNNTIRQFAAIVGKCDILVAGDTIALHLAVAQKINVIALFGPTCSQEIDLYGRGTKITSQIKCAPCYKSACTVKPNCMDLIRADDVFKEIKELARALKKYSNE